MSAETLRQDLFSLITFLVVSASGLSNEPAGYGTFRLLEAAGRLMDIMEQNDLLDDALRRLKQQLDQQRSDSMDDQRLQAYLERMVSDLAIEMQQRLSDDNIDQPKMLTRGVTLGDRRCRATH